MSPAAERGEGVATDVSTPETYAQALRGRLEFGQETLKTRDVIAHLEEFEVPAFEDFTKHFRVEALGPVDGRYGKRVEQLAEIFSERGLMQARVAMEVEYLKALADEPEVGVGPFDDEQIALLDSLKDLSVEDALRIKDYEFRGVELPTGKVPATNHDVKAVEYFIKEKLRGTSLEADAEWVHFALTSEDVNNIAYGEMLRRGGRVLTDATYDLMDDLFVEAGRYRDLPMLARTHGQPASPTTYGKELAVFARRLEEQLVEVDEASAVSVKLNGASGNYDAHTVAYPGVDWQDFSERFVGRLNSVQIDLPLLRLNLITTQIEPHDSYAKLFDAVKRLNGAIVDFDQDMWRYISDNWVKQKPKEGEIGSSAMPHKVNPIDFENSEGNAEIAIALCEVFSRKLQRSRLQRDLSDSTVERNFGVAFGHTLLAIESARKGFGKCAVDGEYVTAVLREHPEVLAEAVQTILRREGVPGAYEQLKQISRGRPMTLDNIAELVENLDVNEEAKAQILALRPETYIGAAPELVNRVVHDPRPRVSPGRW